MQVKKGAIQEVRLYFCNTLMYWNETKNYNNVSCIKAVSVIAPPSGQNAYVFVISSYVYIVESKMESNHIKMHYKNQDAWILLFNSFARKKKL